MLGMKNTIDNDLKINCLYTNQFESNLTVLNANLVKNH